jgi:hypothetical protein
MARDDHLLVQSYLRPSARPGATISHAERAPTHRTSALDQQVVRISSLCDFPRFGGDARILQSGRELFRAGWSSGRTAACTCRPAQRPGAWRSSRRWSRRQAVVSERSTREGEVDRRVNPRPSPQRKRWPSRGMLPFLVTRSGHLPQQTIVCSSCVSRPRHSDAREPAARALGTARPENPGMAHPIWRWSGLAVRLRQMTNSHDAASVDCQIEISFMLVSSDVLLHVGAALEAECEDMAQLLGVG